MNIILKLIFKIVIGESSLRLISIMVIGKYSIKINLKKKIDECSFFSIW